MNEKNNIIHALRRCAANSLECTYKYCTYCPYSGKGANCRDELFKAAADLLENSVEVIEAEGVLCATFSSPELRPCLVNGKKAYFHRWSEHSQIVPPSLLKGGHCGGQVQSTVGIFENEDGTVFEALPPDVQFLDRTEREEPRP